MVPHDTRKLHFEIEELEDVDPTSARVFRAFMTALRLHKQQMMRSLGAHGMHPGQAICLRVLAAHDDLPQRDLAEALHLSPPTITKMLQSLERGGAVERSPDPRDQRLTRVRLTSKGRELEKEMRKVAAAYIGRTIATMPEDDRRELARLLEALGECLERTAGDACETSGGGEMCPGGNLTPGPVEASGVSADPGVSSTGPGAAAAPAPTTGAAS